MLTATYSPDDNKLRLYATTRLDRETYDRVKAAGFKWAPKQDLFVAPMWTPAREDLLLELCGEIGDEDTSLAERAEERAERFADYADKRGEEAEAARQAVHRIADNIPLGQPILVGHHSERHARKDAERIRDGMKKAISLWKTSQYWEDRAKSAISHAKYKERNGVRARRIKGIEADKRKQERSKAEAEKWLELWSKEGLTHDEALRIADHCWIHLPRKDGDREGWSTSQTAYGALTSSHPNLYAPRTLEEVIAAAKVSYPRTIASCNRWIEHYNNRLTYERAMLDENGGLAGEQKDLKPGGSVLVGDNWLVILRVNKSGGIITSVTTTAPPHISWRTSWKYGIEEIKDYRPPTEEIEKKVKAATKLPPLCNYPGEGFLHMTKAEWDGRFKRSDFSYVDTRKATETVGAHRLRQMPAKNWSSQYVYLTDTKRVDPPAPEKKEPIVVEPDPTPTEHTIMKRVTNEPSEIVSVQTSEKKAQFEQLQEALKNGIQITVVNQLFATPQELATRMVKKADLQPGESILEPSAGTGAILDAIAKDRSVVPFDVCAVEINHDLAHRLAFHDTLGPKRIIEADFLSCNDSLGMFDKIIMNPPFQNGSDIKHILHAMQFLKSGGGRLVALCANGPRQKEQLMPLADTWEELPAGSFKEQGTNVNVALLIINK